MTLRNDFPIFQKKPDLIYLDSASTSQKPQCVIDAVADYYGMICSNVHRAIYPLGIEAEEKYEGARESVRKFIGAAATKEVIFTKNASEAINLVAQSWGRQNLKDGDTVLLTEMEHHSMIVPWQLLRESGPQVELSYVGLDDDYRLDMVEFERLLTEKRPKLVAVTGMSNVLGTVNDVKTIVKMAHEAGAKVLVDGAQLVAHKAVDVVDLECDWLVFTGHKLLGPTGAGVLYGREDILDEMPPFLGGGDMITTVGFDKSTWHELPWKFEAGTPNIAGVIGMGAAVEYLMGIGMDEVERIEGKLTEYALEKLEVIEGLKLFGSSRLHVSTQNPGEAMEPPSSLLTSVRGGIFSFELEGVHAHDVAQILGEDGVCVRAGHHCAMPLMGVLGTAATARASLHIYNTTGDVDKLIEGIEKVKSVFH